MTSTRKARPASRWLGLLGASLVACPGLAHALTLDLVYERTVMTAAGERCGLFTPEISAALAAGQAQAHAAALRAGATPEALASVEQRARGKGSAVDCASADVATAADRVRNAFAGFARIQRMSYPGDMAGWRADRTGPDQIRWRLAQESHFGPDRMIFGLAGRDGRAPPVAVAQFADDQAPYAARLLMRDGDRSSGPYLDRLNAAVRRLPLDRRLPPWSALKVYAAEARSAAGADLLPKDARSGWAFRFPAQAAARIAALDPRESVAVEFLFPGDVVRRGYVEVGDFAAGQAFLKLSQR